MTDRVGQPVCCIGRHHSIPFSTFDSAFKSHLIPFKNNTQYKKRQYSKIPFPRTIVWTSGDFLSSQLIGIMP